MSDFFARLTARHSAGHAPTIVPRAASRFETAALPVEREATPSASIDTERSIARAPESSVAPTDRRPSRAHEPIADVAAREQATEPQPIERTTIATATRIEQILKEVRTIVNTPASGGPEARRETPRDPEIVAQSVIPRIAPSDEPRLNALGRTSIGPTASEQSEPTVIRVHIGRIDVRASAPNVDRQRSRTKAGNNAEPMSLDRYLTGKDRS